MFDVSKLKMEQLVIHKVGNKLKDEGIVISPELYQITDGDVEELLMKYFLSSFREKVLYKFFHETDIHLNEIYMYAAQAFISPDTFYSQSINMLKHLYEKSSHPQIKGGEFYVVYFSGCVINEQQTDAIGIFKTERKENYLKIANSRNSFSVGSDIGINIKKLDKGCIIFNSESVDGFRVAIVDNVNKGGNNEALYWKEEFLRLSDVQNNYFHTKNCLDMCQDFADTIYGPVYQADKKDRVVFMNEAISYFSNNNEFNLEDFAHNVVKKPELIEQFKEHKQLYDINQGIDQAESFSISGPAVKTVRRKFNNLIKLDTEIEIRIKTAAAEVTADEFIERGFDEQKGMYFYKVYFNDEE
ncbi:nucleoid-associated protein [Dendrosporobacter sp. 1207_IL3150]|uniref:nucleoid-associated protein n=1 Tax=Dendrosporobacter sp. 1207_IL3150 TaxID=3084054 RepID=UPI002FDAF44B